MANLLFWQLALLLSSMFDITTLCCASQSGSVPIGILIVGHITNHTNQSSTDATGFVCVEMLDNEIYVSSYTLRQTNLTKNKELFPR